ncbi:MAG: tRNA (guanine(10)-N(2))-dimethyltransferase [Candidatus Micrarchaeia archaeon]
MKAVKTVEGKAVLRVPRQSLENPFGQEVFYNPQMAFNRLLSTLALKASLKRLTGANALDGLSSLGARGIRYALESKVKKVVLVDANPVATKMAKANLKLNKIPKRVQMKVVESDLNRFFLNSSEKFDFVEIDPFGTPVFFLENAFRAISKKAVLSVTATDLANLYGTRPKACVRQYDSKPLHNFFAHETALRILAGRIARVAAMLDFAATPLLSFYKRHYVKTFVLVEKSALKADETLKKNIGFLSFCRKCFFVQTGKIPLQNCPICKANVEWAGPLWTGKLSDQAFLVDVEKLVEKSKLKEKKELMKLFSQLVCDNQSVMPAWFFDVPSITSKFKVGVHLKLDDLVKALQKKGFKACRTHFSPTGIKTDASVRDVLLLIKSKK